MAFNLIDALMGKTTQNLFSSEDMGKIKIIDRDNCEKLLHKHPVGKNSVVVGDLENDGLMQVDDNE